MTGEGDGLRRDRYPWIVAAAGTAALIIALVLNWFAAGAVRTFDQHGLVATTRVTAIDYFASTSVTVHASIDRETLRHRGPGGVVTSVTASPGQPIRSGDAVLSINGVRVIAWSGQVTFFRDLMQASQGSDVAELQRHLVLLGYLANQPTGRFDAATAAAVRKFQVYIGAVERDGVFRPHYVMRLSADEVTPIRVLVRQDDQIVSGATVIEAAKVDPKLQIISTADVPDGEYLVTVGNIVFSAAYSGGQWAAELPPGADLLAELPPEHDSASSGVVALRGFARHTSSVPALVFPPAALIVADNDHSCVVRVVGDAMQLVRVRVIAADVSGAVLVYAGEQLFAEDLINLRPDFTHRSCT